jgi:phage terminase large subunit-like protein
MLNDNVFLYSIDASSYKKLLILTPKKKQKSQTISCLSMSQLNSQGFNVHTIVASNKISLLSQ